MGLLNLLTKSNKKEKEIQNLKKQLENKKKERLEYMKLQTENETLKFQLDETKKLYEKTLVDSQKIKEDEFFLRFITLLEKNRKPGELYNRDCLFFYTVARLKEESHVIFSFNKYFLKIYDQNNFKVYDSETMIEITIKNRTHIDAISNAINYFKNDNIINMKRDINASRS